MKGKRMENQTFKQNRNYFLISAMFLIGIFVYMGIRIGFLYFGLKLQFTNSLQETVNQHRTLLMIIDELLMLSTILCGSSFFNVRKVYSQNKNILTGFVTTSFILMLITWLLIMFETGRLVYPVNGLPVVTGDNLRTTLAEIYAAWHLCDILLGLFIIFWSGLLSHSLWKYSGITIGLLQMICTYFGQGIKPIPLFIAIILSTIWLLKQSISIVNELREKKV